MSAALDRAATGGDRLGLPSASRTCGHEAGLLTLLPLFPAHLAYPQQERRRFALHSHPQHPALFPPKPARRYVGRLKTHRPSFCGAV